MSKKAKRVNKINRAGAKRSRKAEQRLKYEAWRDAGKNQKSRRAKMNAQARLVHMRSHPNGPCGNIGCEKCHPLTVATNPWLARGGILFGKRWSSPKWRNESRAL